MVCIPILWYSLCVNYPFGFGLSYTDFEISDISASADDENVYIKAKVTNVGKISGKEVVLDYSNNIINPVEIINPPITGLIVSNID